MIVSDGRGSSSPVATNNTAQGRAANRRIEVEFWHDDPLTELPDEPRLCPGAPGSEVVTRVYDPPWGPIEPLQLEQGGRAMIPADYAQQLRRAMTDIADRTNVRLRFIGYTKNERLDRRTAIVYGDDIGLAASRARRAMDTLVKDMNLTPQSRRSTRAAATCSRTTSSTKDSRRKRSHIVVQVVYDEPAVLDDYEGVDIETLTRELSPKNPFALNLMRITVDGEPIDDPNRSSADIQRCTDVALEKADILFQFDNLTSSPRAERCKSAWPTTVAMAELMGTSVTQLTQVTQGRGRRGVVAADSGQRAARADGGVGRGCGEPEELVEIIPVTQALKLVETPPSEEIRRAGRSARAARAALVRHAGALPDVRELLRVHRSLRSAHLPVRSIDAGRADESAAGGCQWLRGVGADGGADHCADA